MARTLVLPLMILLPLSTVWFFWGTGAGPFVGTEALRAVVVKEMLTGGQWPLPTIHGRVYLRKPPLYAWTTVGLAKLLNRFDEQVARWPSSALGVVYVLTMFLAARAWIDARAGGPAAVLAGGNWVIMDYGVRAELDMGVLAFTTLAVLGLGAAWYRPGRRRWLALTGCYTAALIGSFWKAPHVLLTVWLALLGLLWVERRSRRDQARRWVWHPAHGLLVATNMAILVLWFVVLARAVGTGRTAKFVLLEFAARVIPHSIDHLIELLTGLPMFAWTAFPASILAAIWLVPRARANLNDAHRRTLDFALAWLIPNFVFLLFVPAKASRYWMTILAPTVLLATLAWHRFEAGMMTPQVRAIFQRLMQILFGLGVLAGLLTTISGVMIWVSRWNPIGMGPDGRWAILIGGIGVALCSLMGGLAIQRRLAPGWPAAMFVLILLIAKPVQVLAFLPGRAAYDSLQPSAILLDQHVPPGETVYVLSDRPGSDRSGEFSDLGFYSDRLLRWPRHLDDALAAMNSETGFLLTRRRARERVAEVLGDRQQLVAELPWVNEVIYLLRVQRSAASSRPNPQPTPRSTIGPSRSRDTD